MLCSLRGNLIQHAVDLAMGEEEDATFSRYAATSWYANPLKTKGMEMKLHTFICLRCFAETQSLTPAMQQRQEKLRPARKKVGLGPDWFGPDTTKTSAEAGATQYTNPLRCHRNLPIPR